MITARKTGAGDRRYDVRLRRPDGTVYNRTFRTRREAEAFERSERTARDRGTWADPQAGTVTFTAYAETWLAARTVRGRAVAPRTVETYRYLLDQHLSPTFGSTPLAKINAAAVRSWHARLLRTAPKSVPPQAYRLLHAILATAVDDSVIGANPCRIKGAGSERSDERPILGHADVAAMAEAIDPRWSALVYLAAYGALRFGELMGLRRQDIDLTRGVVVVTGQLVELQNGHHVRTAPKSDAGLRSVALPAFVTAELAAHLDRYVGPEPGAPVFVGTKGGVPTRTNWSRVWIAGRERAGLPSNAHLHDLRHAGATLAAQTGATTKELMARLGHSSPQAALRYQHAADDRDRTIADGLDEIIRRGLAGPVDSQGS
jgi:integrase